MARRSGSSRRNDGESVREGGRHGLHVHVVNEQFECRLITGVLDILAGTHRGVVARRHELRQDHPVRVELRSGGGGSTAAFRGLHVHAINESSSMT